MKRWVSGGTLIVLVLVACGDSEGSDVGAGGGGGATGVSGGSGGGGRSGSGAGGATGPCSIYNTSPTESMITGTGFDAWNGETASGYFEASQSFGPSFDSATVVDGAFSLSGSVCTGYRWVVRIGELGYTGSGRAITPDDCYCSAYAGAPGYGCDADAGAP
jgi:hypothetical protein